MKKYSFKSSEAVKSRLEYGNKYSFSSSIKKKDLSEKKLKEKTNDSKTFILKRNNEE